ncbi:helix-turn-helix domain-containing protein [Metaclostridioides mangenotii]|uniref:Transposase n=1 Tax=Metaclostridioides mangenotii TaxID=1540 RepID=A0ABS4E7P7_9FIRM|nr:helix-turn-helix domain-containing protein [Clostridioides mangenotii]MBP1853965.1 transposase [Clostridioides mangenotii]
MIILRRKSLQEKVEIVRFCIINNFDYARTIKKYKISYQTLYKLISKYEKGGEDALAKSLSKRNEDTLLKEINNLKEIKKEITLENTSLKKELELLKTYIKSDE